MPKRMAASKNASDTGEINIARNATESRPARKGTARCIAIAARGIKTGGDFANVMSSMMSDLLEERIDPRVSNAVCNAGGKLLKVVEMQYKYGSKPGTKRSSRPKLLLAQM